MVLKSSPTSRRCGIRRALKLVSGLGLFLLLAAPGITGELDVKVDDTPIDRNSRGLITSYAPILERVTPAVVAVHTAEVVRIVRSVGPLSPEQEFLRRFFGLPSPRTRPEAEAQVQERKVPSGVGSGVIITPDGFILTNHHVVSNNRGEPADEVLVQLSDGRELPAEIVGRDPKSDIAVLKVEAKDLPVAPIADSELLAVGDMVFAIGNPMGVGLTVTQGIVSATGRAIGIYGEEGYESFIQTDASINPGNSGGALVDARGRLVGINSAILSRTGGSIGIGFAIPTNLAVAVAQQLVGHGEVRRGHLGVRISNLSRDMAQAFDLDDTQGVLVNQVDEGSSAEKAGLERGDVIVSVDARPVRNVNELRLRVGQLLPGSRAAVEVIRKGKRRTFEVVVGEADAGAVTGQPLVGVVLAPVIPELRQRYDLPSDVRGLVVTEVGRTSPFSRLLRPGAVLVEINDRPLPSLEALGTALTKGVNKFYVYDRGRTGYLAVRVP